MDKPKTSFLEKVQRKQKVTAMTKEVQAMESGQDYNRKLIIKKNKTFSLNLKEKLKQNA